MEKESKKSGLYFGKLKEQNDRVEVWGFGFNPDNFSTYKEVDGIPHNNDPSMIFMGDENGDPILVKRPTFEDEEAMTEIAALKAELKQTDYVAAKICEDPDCREHYHDHLIRRKKARERIRELEGVIERYRAEHPEVR